MQQKIVITGGPSTGKSTLIDSLLKAGHSCQKEISRVVTLAARAKGIEQFFLEDPLAFSKELLKRRIEQYQKATLMNKPIVFFDRSILDILAYLKFSNTIHNFNFEEITKHCKFQQVFITPPWRAIYTTDNERHETYDEAQKIHEQLVITYQQFGYSPIEIPFGTPEERMNFILQHVA